VGSRGAPRRQLVVRAARVPDARGAAVRQGGLWDRRAGRRGGLWFIQRPRGGRRASCPRGHAARPRGARGDCGGFSDALLVESSVSSQDPPETDKSDGQKALEEAFEIAIEVAEDFLALLRTEGEQFAIGVSHEPPQNAGPGWLLDIEAGGRVRNVGLPQPLVVYAGSEESALGHDLLGKIIDGLREGRKAGTPDLLLADARETQPARACRANGLRRDAMSGGPFSWPRLPRR
jgi:hypothetical protein